MLARARYGPDIGAPEIYRMLEDREVVRYPVLVRFDAADLEPGEFAHASLIGESAREGFCLNVHPCLHARPGDLPAAVAYHVPSVNYGEIVEPGDCEAFGAALLGLSVDEYYARLCAIADSLGGPSPG